MASVPQNYTRQARSTQWSNAPYDSASSQLQYEYGRSNHTSTNPHDPQQGLRYGKHETGHQRDRYDTGHQRDRYDTGHQRDRYNTGQGHGYSTDRTVCRTQDQKPTQRRDGTAITHNSPSVYSSTWSGVGGRDHLPPTRDPWTRPGGASQPLTSVAPIHHQYTNPQPHPQVVSQPRLQAAPKPCLQAAPQPRLHAAAQHPTEPASYVSPEVGGRSEKRRCEFDYNVWLWMAEVRGRDLAQLTRSCEVRLEEKVSREDMVVIDIVGRDASSAQSRLEALYDQVSQQCCIEAVRVRSSQTVEAAVCEVHAMYTSIVVRLLQDEVLVVGGKKQITCAANDLRSLVGQEMCVQNTARNTPGTTAWPVPTTDTFQTQPQEVFVRDKKTKKKEKKKKEEKKEKRRSKRMKPRKPKKKLTWSMLLCTRKQKDSDVPYTHVAPEMEEGMRNLRM